MRPTPFTVRIDFAGLPYIEVPPTLLWDLVEHLSYHRVHVTYHFEGTHFTVVFPHQDSAAVQKLLDNWVEAESHAYCGV